MLETNASISDRYDAAHVSASQIEEVNLTAHTDANYYSILRTKSKLLLCISPPMRTTGGVFIYPTAKGGVSVLASREAGFFHATTKEVSKWQTKRKLSAPRR